MSRMLTTEHKLKITNDFPTPPLIGISYSVVRGNKGRNNRECCYSYILLPTSDIGNNFYNHVFLFEPVAQGKIRESVENITHSLFHMEVTNVVDVNTHYASHSYKDQTPTVVRRVLKEYLHKHQTIYKPHVETPVHPIHRMKTERYSA